ncbi:acyl-CoA dehydrogenase family protein [Salinispora sp. H7-4]|uniref:acyl-CoA dehydrogenase family protein n=1 Tax=Salinispora sp. H7-4 TaxID=2748321 RepID=UPI0015D192F5|nr:acyl-CoA dehydrogenase family protein [Salinispora sp. H7-4]NYT95644.1 acyl-CoA/acyl-ACP dehydrogenase [Salinispora sp. H7-4]
MDFALTDEQRDLQVAAARYLADRYPPDRIAALADAAAGDPDAWPELRRQGWCDPELGMVEKGLLAQENGYALHPTAWWSTVGLAQPVHRAAGAAMPPGPLTLAWQDEAGTDGGCRAAPAHGGGWRLVGTRCLVTDVAEVSGVLVAADTPDGLALFAVAMPADGMTVTPQPTLDRLRRTARLRFAGTPAEPLVTADTGRQVLAAARRHGGTLLACEAVGVARLALDLARRHAEQRVQFGRPIGAYQAVAHQLADSYVAVELATSLSLRAAWLVGAADRGDADEAEVGPAYAAAVVAAREAAVRACETALQVTGGLGATWEYPLHWWYRRALWLDCFDLPTAAHLATLASQVLAAPA